MMNKKDTRLLPFIVEFEKVLKSSNLSDEEHDLQLSKIMTEMERKFGVPSLNNEHFNRTFPECIELYRKISDARVTLEEDGILQIGKKIKVVDGEQFRTAKAYDRKDIGTSVWFMCIDQDGEFGYAFDEKTIEWTGSYFVYDCQKHNTPLSMITGGDNGP
ncbi:hypothetical protein [Paenibacillus tyrfis]|uniref:hypothetical protein n=1 Tax=Paenibacillus tyrfis TaxID=1501230 RepID=UPI000B58E245|nr:hypothetical protein [Paenibacillus tyrfis]